MNSPAFLRTARSAIRRLRGSQLGGLAGDAGFVAVWQGARSVADLVQIALITHALGLREYGRFALVVSFVVLVGQFFDVRVGAVATTFGARKLATDKRAAAGIFQFSYLIDALTGVVGFVVVVALSFAIGPHLIGGNGATLIVLYALTLLASTVDESSLAALRLLDRFRLISGYTVALEVLRIGLVVIALEAFDSLAAVLAALVVYQLFTGVVNAVAAALAFRRAAGVGLTMPALGLVRDERRQMLSMVLHTNVVSYARIAQVQLPALLIGALTGARDVGVYKIGMAVGAIAGRIADPAASAFLPRLSRLMAAGRRLDVRRLLGRVSMISIPAMAIVAAAIIALRNPIVDLLGGGSSGAGSIVVLAVLAQAINGALFWNVGVLWVTGRARAMSWVAIGGAVLQLGLLLLLVPRHGPSGAAVAFLASITATNVVAAWVAVRAVAKEPAQEDAGDTLPADALVAVAERPGDIG